MRRKLLCAFVLCATSAAANTLWDSEKAIAAARATCPQNLPVTSWRAEFRAGMWEVRGSAGPTLEAYVSIPVNSDKPPACSITRAPPSSNLRAI